jgi:tetratricopeptide (TPR) repeat protein
MSNFIAWFKNLKPPHQVVFAAPILSAFIAGFFALAVACINTFGTITSQDAVKKIEYSQYPEVKRVNSDIFEYFKQIDNKSDVNEKKRLLNIVFENLARSISIDPNDGETHFLHAEACLQNNDYNSAISHYDDSLAKNYLYVGNVYLGYGYAYEALGDQYISNNDLSSAAVYYKHAVDFLTSAVNSSERLHESGEAIEIKKLLSRVELKNGNYKYAEEYFEAFSAINKDSNNSNNIYAMIELANSYADLKLWKNAVRCYYWLFRQDVSRQQRSRIMRDFQYYSDFWEFSDGFIQDISINSVKAIMNTDSVNFRSEPIIDINTIRSLQKFEEVEILQRSDYKQSIGNVKTYWYKIRTSDGYDGWVYGQYLCFYPNFSL